MSDLTKKKTLVSGGMRDASEENSLPIPRPLERGGDVDAELDALFKKLATRKLDPELDEPILAD